jgi:hypothetical protein
MPSIDPNYRDPVTANQQVVIDEVDHKSLIMLMCVINIL